MLKINFIIEYFWPEIGGLEKSTERLAEEVNRQGHKVRVITKRLENTKPYQNYLGFEVKRFDGDYIKKAAESGLLEDCDINCVFGVGHDTTGKSWSPIFTSGKPTFIKIGTSGDLTQKGFAAETFEKFDAILCQNDELVEEVKSLAIEGLNSETIKNGLNISNWQSMSQSKIQCRDFFGIDKNAKVVSAIGRIVKRKNFPLIIKACAKLANKLSLTLIIQGSDFDQHDGEEKAVRQLCLNLMSDTFKIIWVSPIESTPDVLKASDIFITMGNREGAPNILIEALATGLPVVTSDISGHKMYVKDNGFLVPMNCDAIMHALETIFSDQNNYRNYSKNSLLLANNFDIEITSKMYLDIFYKYLNKESK